MFSFYVYASATFDKIMQCVTPTAIQTDSVSIISKGALSLSCTVSPCTCLAPRNH